MSVVIKDVPIKYRFKVKEKVMVKGDRRSGVGYVFQTCYLKEQPTSEIPYGLLYDEPFPQIAVRFDKPTRRIHYNADDLLQGKIQKIVKKRKRGTVLG